jgi:hypothetical protein
MNRGGVPNQFNGGGGDGQFNPNARPFLGQGELRQIRDQANQISNDVQELRRQMQGQAGEVSPQDLKVLEDALNALRQMGATADPNSIQGLSATALEKLQTFDYTLRKKLDNASEQLLIKGSDEVAPQFKKPVADYFTELSKRTKGGGK